MSDNRQKLVHLHSSSVKVPQATDLNYGEIAVQYAKESPILYIKNTNDEIVKFIDSGAIATILGSYVTNDTLTGSYATSANTHAAINAVAQKLVNVYTYKGSVATYENLPSENLTAGDVYNVEAAHGNIPPGTNYAWNGSAWDSLGGSVDLSNYSTTGDVNTLSSSVQTLESTVSDLQASAHTHSNKSVLDGIDATKVGNWDEAAASAHTHANIDVLTGITSQDVDGWDEAAASAHTHANSDVLDGITSAKTEQWDSAYTISQNALIGIETGKENGASVNASNELDFSGLYIDCGEY